MGTSVHVLRSTSETKRWPSPVSTSRITRYFCGVPSTRYFNSRPLSCGWETLPLAPCTVMPGVAPPASYVTVFPSNVVLGAFDHAVPVRNEPIWTFSGVHATGCLPCR